MAEITLGHPESAADWAAVRDICCDTGAAGQPIAPARRPFFGEFWIGPYQRLLPGWTFVARAEGRVIGYLTGCPSSFPFYIRRFFRQRLPLLAGVLAGRWGWTEDARRFVFPAGSLRRNFALRFGPWLYTRLMLRYPAHLHINVDAARRTAGLGRRLIDAYVEALEARGVRGLHLFCGKNPVEFYRRTGFHKLACLDLGRGPVYIMVRRLKKR